MDSETKEIFDLIFSTLDCSEDAARQLAQAFAPKRVSADDFTKHEELNQDKPRYKQGGFHNNLTGRTTLQK